MEVATILLLALSLFFSISNFSNPLQRKAKLNVSKWPATEVNSSALFPDKSQVLRLKVQYQVRIHL